MCKMRGRACDRLAGHSAGINVLPRGRGEKGEAYNIADESSNISIRDLADMIADVSGRKVIIEDADQEEKNGYNPVAKSVFSTTKIESLGWKVTGIMNFGAFVALPGGKSGLVHISEIANTFVKDVHDHLQIGQQVRVKVLGINEQGKINLSIKAVAAEERKTTPPAPAAAPVPEKRKIPEFGEVAPPTADQTFEEKLKKFMQASDSKNADKRRNTERKQHARRK